MFASLTAARGALDEVARELDTSGMSADAASRLVSELGTIRRVVDGMLARAARRVCTAHPSAHDATASVARTLGVPVHEVRAAMVTAAQLEHLPATDAAVRDGRLSAREAQLIAAAATTNPAAEQQLLATAEHGLVPLHDACVAARAEVEEPASRAARQHARRRWSTWTDDDGMLAGRFLFTPEVGGKVKAVVESEVQRLFRARRAGTRHEPLEAYAADAVAAFVLDGNHAGEHPKGTNAVVHVVVDHGALVRGGAVDGERCEIPGVGPVDVGWVRDLLGTAFVTAVIKRGKDISTVAHLGRHIGAEVLTAMLVSGRECDVEDCFQRGYLERDHIYDHALGGPTAFWNLGWLCYRHHRLKSDGWRLGPPDPGTRKRKLRPPPARAA